MRKGRVNLAQFRFILPLLLVLTVLTVSCEDVFENNISDENVIPVFPLANDTVKTSEVTFDWNKIEGADKYRLQVNDENSKRVLDTLVEPTFFTYGLESGRYTWRVRAENFAYQTAYIFPATFVVEAIDDLSTQNVVISSPTSGVYFNDPSEVVLSWESLKYADSYTVSVDKKKTSGTVTLDLVENITNSSLAIDASYLEEDAEYVLRVKAVNESTESVFSASSFILDTTLPLAPAAASPIKAADVGFTVDFSWNSPTDVGATQSPVTSTLQIATDDGFLAMTKEYLNLEGQTQQHTFDSAGEYYWRVINKDEAGNISTASEVRNFTVQ